LYNFYWAILCPILVLTETPSCISNRKNLILLVKPLLGCIVVGLFLGFGQMSVQTEQYHFAKPEAFSMRAALDVFSIVPLDWNRMGFWQPLNPIVLILGGWGILSMTSTNQNSIMDNTHIEHRQRRHTQIGLMLCLGFSVMLSFGPLLTAKIPNLMYQMFSLLPGMWRFAKPEIFMLLAYSILGIGMLSKQWSKVLWGGTVIIYLWGLYSSPAFPYLTEFVEGNLHY